MGTLWLRLESKPGLGLQDSQQVSNVQVAVELYLFFSRQSSSLRSIRQLQHSLPVAFPKVDRQQEFGGLGGQFTLLRLHQAGPNSRLGVWTEKLRTQCASLNCTADCRIRKCVW